jgi:hypothetical protein
MLSLRTCLPRSLLGRDFEPRVKTRPVAGSKYAEERSQQPDYAIAMCMAGQVVAAVATMFLPVRDIGGHCRFHRTFELVPAARAPLG